MASVLATTDLLMLLLPRKGILAIAAVIDIALHARGRPVAAKALATRHRLPPRHLEPVLQALVRHGILKGIRGPRGGYELAREQRRITADDILRAAGTVDEIDGAADQRLEPARAGGDPRAGRRPSRPSRPRSRASTSKNLARSAVRRRTAAWQTIRAPKASGRVRAQPALRPCFMLSHQGQTPGMRL